MNGGRCSVTSVTDVLEEHGVQWGVRKRNNRIWYTSTSSLNGNIVVLFEVDTGVLLRGIVFVAEELLLHAHVTAAGDVLAIPPGAVAERLTGARLGTAPTTRSSTAAVPAAGATSATSVRAEAPGTEAVVASSIAAIATTGRRSRRAGVVPAVPAA